MTIQDLLSAALAWSGLAILLVRLWPRGGVLTDAAAAGKRPRVSIVVPARDEADNLTRLLPSLKNIDYADYEIVVVDDNSRDGTRSMAASFGVKVVSAPPPPPGWNGKNWACAQAVPHLTGDIFLFTDADTEHGRDGLARAIDFFVGRHCDMMSALPYHRLERWWERLLGPFHTILLAATAPYSPRPKRLFAIGQYLLFSRASYEAQGGHAAVWNQYPDDLALANACLERKGRFLVYMGPPLFRVRMYADFPAFVSGWRRNFLAGIQQSNGWATVETVLIFCALAGAGRLFSGWLYAVPALVAAVVIAVRQRRWGSFSWVGVALMPVSLLIFCGVTALAVYDALTGNVLRWKGRRYTGWVKRSSPAGIAPQTGRESGQV